MKRDPKLVVSRVDAAGVDSHGRKVALVGGTGGIGRAFSRFLAARGASAISVGRTFRDAGVPGIAFVRADLSDVRESQLVGMALPAETFRIAQLRVAPEVENHSGAMFHRKGYAILPSLGMTESHVQNFMAVSAALLSKVNLGRT
jgi:NAD(P)-dependent dehydrogenase (short-subunit alcohol dehydrogenase family)